MNRLVTYLLFNGNCREVMSFYQRCLGGELSFHTLGETTHGHRFPESMKHLILQARLTRDQMVLLGSDLTGHRLSPGNQISIMLEYINEEEAKAVFSRLLEGGRIETELTVDENGRMAGSLTDKYGNQWLFHQQEQEIINQKDKP